MATDMGTQQNVKEQGIGSEYIRMFENLKWNTKFKEKEILTQDDPHLYIIAAIKKPSRIRNKDGFINALKKKKTEFNVIDGHNKDGENLYECYKIFIDEQLADKPIKVKVKEAEKEKKENHIYNNNKSATQLLKEWNLRQYINKIINDEGYEDVEDWRDLEYDELIQMGLKVGHAKRFVSRKKSIFGGN